MKDYSYLFTQKRYPADRLEIRRLFSPQRTGYTCGPAACRHGLLLGGLVGDEELFTCLFGTADEGGTDGETIQAGLTKMGFEVEQVFQTRRQTTTAFLDQIAQEMRQGAYALACIGDGGNAHWVCVAAWEDGRLLVVNSWFAGLGPFRRVGFHRWTADEFDDAEWGNSVQLVRPGCWVRDYREWLPFRWDLLYGMQTRLQDRLALANRALNSPDYAYDCLRISLRGGANLEVRVEDPVEDSVLLEGTGESTASIMTVQRLRGHGRGDRRAGGEAGQGAPGQAGHDAGTADGEDPAGIAKYRHLYCQDRINKNKSL